MSGVTSHVWSSTRSVPSHDPTCAKRAASRRMRVPARVSWRGSSWVGNEPFQVRSKVMPCSSASHTRRSFCNGSITSMRYGPTCCTMRSSPSGPDVRTATWRPGVAMVA